MAEDDLDHRMQSLAVNELVYNDIRSTDQVVKEVEALSLKSVNDYLKTYLDKEPGIVMLGAK
jgi:predicted Zn-dependent peptidase